MDVFFATRGLHMHRSISLLTPFEPCADYTDWTIGEHGIYIHVPSSSGRWLTATYLPDVIPEQGWSKREAVDSAIRKAGHTGSIDEALRRRLKVERYRSEKCSRTYEQWRAARA
jgi:AMMECR1 domain-containing protein